MVSGSGGDFVGRILFLGRAESLCDLALSALGYAEIYGMEVIPPSFGGVSLCRNLTGTFTRFGNKMTLSLNGAIRVDNLLFLGECEEARLDVVMHLLFLGSLSAIFNGEFAVSGLPII
jgi:hypothetical protein